MKRRTIASISLGFIAIVLLIKLAVFCGLIFLAVKLLQFMGVI